MYIHPLQHVSNGSLAWPIRVLRAESTAPAFDALATRRLMKPTNIHPATSTIWLRERCGSIRANWFIPTTTSLVLDGTVATCFACVERIVGN